MAVYRLHIIFYDLPAERLFPALDDFERWSSVPVVSAPLEPDIFSCEFADLVSAGNA
jgi:hypothetical protein